jgi:hypothetical protein
MYPTTWRLEKIHTAMTAMKLTVDMMLSTPLIRASCGFPDPKRFPTLR